MLKLKKNITLIVGIFLLIGVGAIAVNAFVKAANTAWNDRTTWSTEARVMYPQETSVLKVKEDLSEIDSSGKQNFSFEAEYCYLYEIEPTPEKATIKCSLLPYYYAKRGEETAKEWKEKSDIYIVIRPDDASPEEFLGRIGKSFSDVSNLGSKKYPVSIKISGSNQYPSPSFANKVNHLLKSYKGEKELLDTSISSYSIKRLDESTPQQRKEYTDAMITRIWREIDEHVNTNPKTFPNTQDLLNHYREVFGNYRLLCSNLSECTYSYNGNPADQFLYYWYLLKTREEPKFTAIFNTMKTVYPFVPRVLDGKACPTCGENWTAIMPGLFPACPINDVLQHRQSKNVEYLYARIDGKTDRSLEPKSAADAMKLATNFNTSSYLETGFWEQDLLTGFDYVCYYVLKNNLSPDAPLAKKLHENYLKMVETMLGVPFDGSRAAFEQIVYESNAYSPYTTRLVLDYTVMKDYEGFMESAQTATGRYLDIRSLWNTLILLYMYEE